MKKKLISLIVISVMFFSVFPVVFSTSMAHPTKSVNEKQACHGWYRWLLKGAYRVEKNGWIFVHLEGLPFQIGLQHGYLLADNLNISWSAAIHVYWSEEEFGDWWLCCERHC